LTSQATKPATTRRPDWQRVGGLDQLVFYLPDAAAQERITARLAAAGVHPVALIDYWQANGGVTYQDPDGQGVGKVVCAG